MAEAEDVILSAAERVASATRRVWAKPTVADAQAIPTRRARCSGSSAGSSRASAARWPLVVCDRPPPAGWLRRALGRPAPWEARPAARGRDRRRVPVLAARTAFDSESGASRRVGARAPIGRRACRAAGGGRRSAATSAGCSKRRRATRRSRHCCPVSRRVSMRARAAALAERPPARRSCGRPSARIEELVRALLLGRAHAARAAASRRDRSRRPPRYRGRRAASAHSGRATAASADLRGCRSPARFPSRRDRRARRRGPRLRQPPPAGSRRRPAREQPGRPGPFIVPAADPHLSVQDPRGVDRPADRGDEDLGRARRGDLATGRARAPSAPSAPCARCFRTRDHRARCGSVRTDTRRCRLSALPRVGLPRQRVPRPRHRAARAARAARRDPDWAAAGAAAAGSAARARCGGSSWRCVRVSSGCRARSRATSSTWTAGSASTASASRADRPDGRSTASTRRRRRDIAVALLVDASGSTDAWISRRARVIDVAKEAVLCFSEALAAVGDRHAIYAFSGQGPGDVRVWVAKRFSEPLGAARAGAHRRAGARSLHAHRRADPARDRRAGAESAPRRGSCSCSPTASRTTRTPTRATTASRTCARRSTKRRAIGVRPFCVTIDRRGPAYLPRLFGPSGYTLLWDATQLPMRLPQIYRHLTRGVSG